MLSAIGLILDCLGVGIIMIHTLYDLGIEAALKIVEKIDIENDQNITSKFLKGEKLSPKEKERLLHLIKENITFKSAGYIVLLWDWINVHIFRFYAWTDEKPRVVNRYLWNFCGLFLILVGFIFQLMGALRVLW